MGAKGRDKRPAFDALCKDATQRKFDVVMLGASIALAAAYRSDLEEQETMWLNEDELIEGARRYQLKIASHSLALAFALDRSCGPFKRQGD